jgi:hypothetical protein
MLGRQRQENHELEVSLGKVSEILSQNKRARHTSSGKVLESQYHRKRKEKEKK